MTPNEVKQAILKNDARLRNRVERAATDHSKERQRIAAACPHRFAHVYDPAGGPSPGDFCNYCDKRK